MQPDTINHVNHTPNHSHNTPKTIQLLSNKLLIHVSAMITYYAVGVDGMLRAI